jgi:acylphosphatase
MAFKKLEATISGYVQGVGFRFFAQRMAILLGITGCAANLPDGSVRVLAIGSNDKIQEFLMVLQRGPTTSEVEKVDYKIESLDYNDYDTFEIS